MKDLKSNKLAQHRVDKKGSLIIQDVPQSLPLLNSHFDTLLRTTGRSEIMHVEATQLRVSGAPRIKLSSLALSLVGTSFNTRGDRFTVGYILLESSDGDMRKGKVKMTFLNPRAMEESSMDMRGAIQDYADAETENRALIALYVDKVDRSALSWEYVSLLGTEIRKGKELINAEGAGTFGYATTSAILLMAGSIDPRNVCKCVLFVSSVIIEESNHDLITDDQVSTSEETV